MSSLETAKEQIKNQLPIEQLIGEYVQLKSAGSSLVGLCPFHKESTPSFNVKADTGYFKCFGCGKAGDIFTFMMELKGLSFMDSLNQLAQKVGVEISTSNAKGGISKKSLIEVLAKVNSIYKIELSNNESVKKYLQSRGINESISNDFELGFASDNSIVKTLQKKEELEVLLALGIIKNSLNRSGTYEFFRNRLTVPIKNQTSQIIALGGRTLETKEGIPKYLNSSESPIFQKRKNLFGIDHAIQSFKETKRAIIVEGYFDVIIPHSHGHKNTVGCCGTSLTEEHGELLSRYVDRIILLFDGDRAGLNAGIRAFSTLINLPTEVHVCILPRGEDPDSYLRAGGDWNKLIGQSKPIIEFYINAFMQEEDKKSPQHLAKVAGILSSELNKIQNGVLRDALYNEGARLLGINRESFGSSKPQNAKGIKSVPNIKIKLDLIAKQAVVTSLIVPELAEQILFTLDKSSKAIPIIEKINYAFRQDNYSVSEQSSSNFQFLKDLKAEIDFNSEEIILEAQNQLRIGGVNYSKFVKDLGDKSSKKEIFSEELDPIKKMQAKLEAKRQEQLINGK